MENNFNKSRSRTGRFLLLAAFVSFLPSLTSGQPTMVNPPGTRLLLMPPADFRYERGLPGFVSDADSSIIVVSEVSNPYSFDELLQKRLRNIRELGIDTVDFQKTAFRGYQSVQFFTKAPAPDQRSFVLMFGSDKFMVDIALTSPISRFETLKAMLLNSEYDVTIADDFDENRGFRASFEGTDLKVFKKDANTLNTRKTNEAGNTVSWLNLTRMPAAIYDGAEPEDAIDATYRLYRFDKKLVSSDTMIIDNTSLLTKVYETNHGFLKEFTLIGIVKKEDFYLVVMGGWGTDEARKEINRVVNSITFTGYR